MKILNTFFTVFLSLVSSYCFAQNTDTLRVSQSDKNTFEKQILPVRLHYSPIPFANLRQPRFQTHYELINPKNGAYYFIYNDKKQLIQEGIYSIRQFTYQDKTKEHGAFYDSKYYYYKKNGKLTSIHYQQDGRSRKTEYFDKKKRLKKIVFFDKKSSDTEKIEIYKKGQLKETRIYTSFDNYYKEKVNN